MNRVHAEKVKYCMWHVKKVKIYSAKIDFMVSKWSNLNSPGSYTALCYSLLESTVGCPFLCMQEKGNVAYGMLRKVEIHFTKIEFVDCKWSNLNSLVSYIPLCHLLWGPIGWLLTGKLSYGRPCPPFLFRF